MIKEAEQRQRLKETKDRYRRVIHELGLSAAWGIATRQDKNNNLALEVRGRDSRNKLQGPLLLRATWAAELGKVVEEIGSPVQAQLLDKLLSS